MVELNSKISSSDTTFITNEGESCLRDRFLTLIEDTHLFDVLVGYFYSSGFYALYRSLENTERIRILVGIGTGKQAHKLIKQAQEVLRFSHAEVKEEFSDGLEKEMEGSEDTPSVEEGVKKFMEWLRSGKLQIKAYPSADIHAKLYIMTFIEGDKDVGRVITGSSNFSESGLVDNLEFNVELKNRSDYEFAQAKFNELWEKAVDLQDQYIDTIQKRTWLNDSITPYELYLKFLYEYFGEKINRDLQKADAEYLPEGFMDLAYQNDAVEDARSKLEEYGGVFISDVVGLGKTYVAAKLANELEGRHLVIAPPALVDEKNPGSWRNVFRDFNIAATFRSLGNLDEIINEGTEKYRNVFIDEAHRFRSETNVSYEKLAQICRGKRVILVTATPLNNTPQDIFAQVKLFQKARKSTIPNLPNLEGFFNRLSKRVKGLDRQRDYDEYMKAVEENAREIREKVLKYLMVRRTRSEIVKYFQDDLKKQGLRFPEVMDPEPVFYEFNENEDYVFNRTIELITGEFEYARYTPMHYYRGKVTQPEELAEKNLQRFMKVLLVKRLESSFYAFRKTLGRFIKSYEQFLKEFENGNVYVSKTHANKIFELLENDDDEAIQRLVDEDKARRYDTADFKPEYEGKLEKDLAVLKEIERLSKSLDRDPKLLKFLDLLSLNSILRENKLIIFTESKETAEYLKQQLDQKYPKQVLLFFGESGTPVREAVTANFDARAKYPKSDYRILVTTEVLSEGVNLHRSNVVINYDIPWNPTRLMQRVGRVNRVDTNFDQIYTYNFFPTVQSNDQIKLKEAAQYKIQAFVEMLGSDARLLTEGEEVKSHDLFNRLISKKTITGEDEEEESELKYLKMIRDIRDSDLNLFERIKRLPKKARTGRASQEVKANSLLTYFRKGKLQKFYLAGGTGSQEIDFLTAASYLEAQPDTERKEIGKNYYDLLAMNKEAFCQATSGEEPEPKQRGGRDSTTQVIKVLKAISRFQGYTEEEENYVRDVMQLLEEGALPRQTIKTLTKELKGQSDPMQILTRLRVNIPGEFFTDSIAESAAKTEGPREVILSEYYAEP